MTIGQRIAQKRKELGLSQEALGEQLGVSRQSIYKWESDATLPEIEKFILLSRLFSVSVGWLLGVEESPTEVPDQKNDELTEPQLKMVEEIVGRYLGARSTPKKRRGWLYAAAAVVLIIVFSSLFSRLEQLDERYMALQNAVGNVTYSVNSQIGGISNRVEEILKAQNAMTAEYSSEEISADYEKNTVTFAAMAVPKTYEEGMTAEFMADSGGEIVTAAAQLHPGQKFTAEITCALTNRIVLSVVFILPDGTRQTQLLDSYYDLRSSSFPDVMLNDHTHLFGSEVVDGKLSLRDTYVTVTHSKAWVGSAEIRSLQVGLFRNKELIGWGEPCEQPNNFYGFDDENFYRMPDVEICGLTEEDLIIIAALVTDSFGRQFMVWEIPYTVRTETSFDAPYLTYAEGYDLITDPSAWVLEDPS